MSCLPLSNDSICGYDQGILAATLASGGKWGRGVTPPTSRTTFSHLPYFWAPLPPDSRPSLIYSLPQVIKDQKPELLTSCAKMNHSLLFSGVAFFGEGEVTFSRWPLLQISFHWPGYHSLTIDYKISVYNNYCSFTCVSNFRNPQ